jgi:hypothetical protein
MIDAYKVGVTFALNNVVTAELLKIVAQLKEADVAAKSLQATLRGMGTAAAGIAGVATEARAMGDGFKYAATQVEGVRAKMASAGFLTAGASKTAQLGAAFGAYEALKSGMKMEDAVARAMIAAGLPVGQNYMSSGFAGTFQNSIFAATTGYGVSQADTQEAALQAIRGLAPLTPDQREKLLPAILNFAGSEVLGKHGTTMEEAVEAGIGLAHQLRAYSPDQIEPLLGAFAKLSMASPQSLSQMGRASSYYLPLLTAGLGMDPTELMALGTVGSQMGLNTKSGTWLARMFQAPFVADLTSTRQSARKKALEELGILEGGKVVTKDPMQFLSILAQHSSGMTPEGRMKDFVAAFGQEGARAAAIFTDPAVMKNLAALAEGLKNAPGTAALKAQYGNSPQVQFDKAWAELQKAMTHLGEDLMPEVTSAVKAFTFAMKALDAVLQAPEWLGQKAAEGVKSAYGWLTGSAPAASPKQTVVIDHSTHLDGQVLAKSVTQYQIDGMAQSPASSNMPDTRMTPYYPGYAQ